MQHFANVQTRHLIGGEGVLKMFRGRDRRSQGGVSHNDVQIFKHLEEADVDTLVDELAVLTDDAADGNVDLDKINAYLDALDEKDPIPFGVSAEDSLAKFHARHDLLTKELSKSHQKRSKSKRIATKIAASFAVLCIVGAIVLRFALRKYIEEFIGYRRLHNGDIYLPPISHQQGYRHMMSIPLLTLIYAALC